MTAYLCEQCANVFRVPLQWHSSTFVFHCWLEC